jgi:NAD-dependent deacetylase
VHGSIRTSHCPACGAGYPLAEVLELLGSGGGAPHCSGCAGVLKPDVVFFDELMPAAAIERAFDLARQARLLLVVGSSLEVHPVAGLPDVTLEHGGKVAVVNRGPTSIDGRATLRLDGSAGEILSGALAYL